MSGRENWCLTIRGKYFGLLNSALCRLWKCFKSDMTTRKWHQLMQQTCSLRVGNHLQAETRYLYYFFFKSPLGSAEPMQLTVSWLQFPPVFTSRLMISWLCCYRHWGHLKEKWVRMSWCAWQTLPEGPVTWLKAWDGYGTVILSNFICELSKDVGIHSCVLPLAIKESWEACLTPALFCSLPFNSDFFLMAVGHFLPL